MEATPVETGTVSMTLVRSMSALIIVAGFLQGQPTNLGMLLFAKSHQVEPNSPPTLKTVSET